jgi:hypothetical protein
MDFLETDIIRPVLIRRHTSARFMIYIYYNTITEIGPAYPRDLPARALLAPPAPISTAPSYLASSLALDSSNTGVSDLTLLLYDKYHEEIRDWITQIQEQVIRIYLTIYR